MLKDVDAIVVGASFAGLACAASAARRGLRTLVLERKPEPGARPHTTGLVVKEAATEWQIPARMTRQIGGVRLYSPSLKYVDLHSPGYFFLATDTPELMRWLADRAEAAGAEIQCGVEYQGARSENSRIVVEGVAARGRCLIGADGPRSRVARDFQLGRNTRFLAGVEAEFENLQGMDDSRLHCFLDSQLAPGYIGWAIPGVNGTQVGLACRQPHRPDLGALIQRLSTLWDFSRAKIVSRRGGLIPVNGPVGRVCRENVLLTGDAAGLVSPLTGGGIHTALSSGRLAGDAVADWLLEEDHCALSRLTENYPRFAAKRMLRGAFDLRPPNWLLDASLGNSCFRFLASNIFFHTRGLLSLEPWREWGACAFGAMRKARLKMQK